MGNNRKIINSEVFQSVIENSIDLTIITDSEGKNIYVSPQCKDVIGFDERDLLGMTVPDFIHPDDKKKCEDAWAKVMAGESIRQFEYRIFDNKRKIRWISHSAKFVHAGKKNIGMQNIIRDISERKQTEKAFLEASKFREHILSEAPVGISIYEAKSGKCVAANKAIAELIGTNEEQVLAQNFNTIESWKKSGMLNTAISALKDNLKKELEVSLTSTFGKKISLYCYFVPFTAGEKRYLLFTLNDITQRKQMELQLRQSEKMQAIGSLAGGIAHDFNNILQIIVSNAEITKDSLPINCIEQQYQENILFAGLRAKNLIAQILTFSRQDKEKREPISVIPIIEETLRMMRSTLPMTIDIRYEIDANCHNIYGTPTQILQILINLCTNAGYAMQENGGVLKIILHEVEIDESKAQLLNLKSDGNYLKLSVIDSGDGISDKIIERIFEPFYTTKPLDKGSGMGLAVVHGIVKNHQGSILVNSKLGDGTRFDIFLPTICEKVKKVEDVNEFYNKGNERILLVDDEEMIVKVEQEILETLGYKVTAVTSTIEALEIFSLHPDQFDLIFTDQTMPNMTGEQLALEILKIRPEIPIILGTGFSHIIDEKKAKSQGICEFIMKPIDKDKLGRLIRNVLDDNSENNQ